MLFVVRGIEFLKRGLRNAKHFPSQVVVITQQYPMSNPQARGSRSLGVRAVEVLDYSGSGSARYFLIPKRAKYPPLQSWRCMTSEAFITGEGKAG